MGRINIFNAGKVPELKTEDVEKYFSKISKQFKKKTNYLNIIISTRSKILEINKLYLKSDHHTDVIAFNLEEENQPLEGEIYISFEQVKENSKKFNEPEIKELHRVIIHGILHLMGEQDKTEAQRQHMHNQEDTFLKDVCFT